MQIIPKDNLLNSRISIDQDKKADEKRLKERAGETRIQRVIIIGTLP